MFGAAVASTCCELWNGLGFVYENDVPRLLNHNDTKHDRFGAAVVSTFCELWNGLGFGFAYENYVPKLLKQNDTTHDLSLIHI